MAVFDSQKLKLGGPPMPIEEPPVPIKKSVTANYVVCFEDGKRQKTLRRHLATAHGLTPAEYRKKWGLPPDHPIVATNYAKQRSEMAIAQSERDERE